MRDPIRVMRLPRQADARPERRVSPLRAPGRPVDPEPAGEAEREVALARARARRRHPSHRGRDDRHGVGAASLRDRIAAGEDDPAAVALRLARAGLPALGTTAGPDDSPDDLVEGGDGGPCPCCGVPARPLLWGPCDSPVAAGVIVAGPRVPLLAAAWGCPGCGFRWGDHGDQAEALAARLG